MNFRDSIISIRFLKQFLDWKEYVLYSSYNIVTEWLNASFVENNCYILFIFVTITATAICGEKWAWRFVRCGSTWASIKSISCLVWWANFSKCPSYPRQKSAKQPFPFSLTWCSANTIRHGIRVKHTVKPNETLLISRCVSKRQLDIQIAKNEVLPIIWKQLLLSLWFT